MPFAIKLIEKEISDIGSVYVLNERYYSQTVERLLSNGFEDLILVTTADNPEEIDISKTLLEAEVKVEKISNILDKRIRTNKSYISTKIIEYPEVEEND